MICLTGTKIVEVPYFRDQLVDNNKSVLIVGEHLGGTEGVSETVKELGFTNVTTTDILPAEDGSWLKKNTTWNHIQVDFINFDESCKYDYVLAISVFEHFGFWFSNTHMADGTSAGDQCFWDHDIRGINKACKLLKNSESKAIITLPVGRYMNYEQSGHPFLRYYDVLRQEIIRTNLLTSGYVIKHERFYYTSDFNEWSEVGAEINQLEFCYMCNPITPNIIWGITIQKSSS
jgi:hypothetical protein